MQQDASSAEQETEKPYRIDLHHHFLPQSWIEAARSHKPDGTWLDAVVNWRPEVSIEAMDRYGVATAIVELGLPGVWWAPPTQARELARETNEYAAKMVRDFPGRFGFFATLPLPDVDGSLTEIAYALDVLHADGIGLLTSYGDKWPGEPVFAPVFDELNRRKAVAHFHPTVPNGCIGLIAGVTAATEEYLFDTARAITSLLHSKTFARCADMNFVFSHGGGAFPPLAHRIVGEVSGRRPDLASAPGGEWDQLARLYFDVATVMNPVTYAGLRAFMSPTRILLGTDLPYLPMSATIPDLDARGLSAEDARLINTDNALRLFPHLKR